MKGIQTTEAATLDDVKAAAGAYLEALEKDHAGETIGTFLYHLYKQLHVHEEIEKTSIQIAEALAAFNSQYVHERLADEMGGYWVDGFCDFLARLNKALLFMASCKTVRASVAVQYLEQSDHTGPMEAGGIEQGYKRIRSKATAITGRRRF
jgi:hypothetical protein